MDSSKSSIDYYQTLLQRYARRILKDEIVAKKLVKKIFKSNFENNQVSLSSELLKVLKADLLNNCYYYNQSQIFDRPLIKVDYSSV